MNIKRENRVPKFSVIVPVYNLEAYVSACLESVAAQTYSDFECICIDDGSTDQSGFLLDRFVEKDSRFKVIHQKNAGVSVARNMALDHAQGEWILFLDGDDTWANDLLAQIIKRIDRNAGTDAVCFRLDIVNEKGVSIGNDVGLVKPTIMKGDSILANGRGPYNGYIWSACDKAYRRKIIEQYGIRFMPDLRLCEDSLFTQVFLAQCGNVVIASDIIGYHYFMRKGSAVHSKMTKLPTNPFVEFEVLSQLWKNLRKPGLLIRLKWLAASCYSLGKNQIYDRLVRADAIVFLSESNYFNYTIVPFLIVHGSYKARILSCLYYIAPAMLKRRILMMI